MSAAAAAADNNLELEREKTANKLEYQAGRFEVEKMQLNAKVIYLTGHGNLLSSRLLSFATTQSPQGCQDAQAGQ